VPAYRQVTHPVDPTNIEKTKYTEPLAKIPKLIIKVNYFVLEAEIEKLKV